MLRDKLKSFDLKYFFIPLFVLILVFLILTYVFVRSRIQEKFQNFANTAITISESYSQMLRHSREAYDTINELLNEKLEVASQAVMLIQGTEDNEVLSELANRFRVDEIYAYDVNGTITHSSNGNYIGWKAYEGHLFMIS